MSVEEVSSGDFRHVHVTQLQPAPAKSNKIVHKEFSLVLQDVFF